MKVTKTLMTLGLATMMLPTLAADELPKGAADFSKSEETDSLRVL